MKAFYYLKTCNTCQRILETLQLPDTVVLREIKSQPLTAAEIQEMLSRAGSYEALFSKRARLYQERGLKNQALSDTHFKSLLLEHYTFLKRPVLIWEDQIFVGNSKKTIEEASNSIHG